MVHAYVMVRTEAGTPQKVRDAVADLDAVSAAHVVAGDYDLIVEVDAPEVTDVLDVATDQIQGQSGVLETKTYVGMSE
ncbi:ArsR family transcriptional regulator [Halodesulfurarchaeum formicicum]|uniref:ArsR family transcriptional regulator n=1 Tax=Halodesulfurarchaeum formicicum TaxID=1873524 RepID=A0A1D8S702_9EURY|nr:Lrp/AsnC ligand binding domain-containing protein [Halodesulfurarchaeum formicicum]AOW81137.1 ArsR family transcriptional regulator [Halodesulfurarchaeum formicicum]